MIHRHDLRVERWILVPLLLLGCVAAAFAEGPRWVAGVTYFNSSVKGKPIVWRGGSVAYFTDQGPLSSFVSNADAAAMVARAAVPWNGVDGASVRIVLGGQLDEDVNGTDVLSDSAGISFPVDVQSTNGAKPLPIIYDTDGAITEMLLGAGASDPDNCKTASIIFAVDAFGTDATIQHARILLNGRCAADPDQVLQMQYELSRVFGRILGLDWSQANDNVFTGAPTPTSGDMLGWPLMHPIDIDCVLFSFACVPSAGDLRPDDRAALRRLYPSSSGQTPTLRIHGTIRFAGGTGMQGVNVVARPLLPGTHTPDSRFTVTTVSGELFRGDVGNAVSGYMDALGTRKDRFGSDDPALQGFYDLSGIELPPGMSAADFEVTLEPIHALYTGTEAVGPQIPGTPLPSGTLQSIILKGLSAGSDTLQDFTLQGSALDSHASGGESESSPATVPPTGEWQDRISGYGHTGWFQMPMKANRIFSVEAQPLDESGNVSGRKVMPVIGLWTGNDPLGSSPDVSQPISANGTALGLTYVVGQTTQAGIIRIGIADQRGDGRPDYVYRGRVLYADNLSPERAPENGGPIVIHGRGFKEGSIVSVAGIACTVLSATENEIVFIAPSQALIGEGDATVTITDPLTTSTAALIGALTYGAGQNDSLVPLSAPTGVLPVGSPAAIPITLRVVSGDEETPVANASVTFTAANASLTMSSGLVCPSACVLPTAADGTASVIVAASGAGRVLVSAFLQNGAYVDESFTALNSASSSIAITPALPSLTVAPGGSVNWQPAALVTVNGVAAPGQPVSWSSNGQALVLQENASFTDTSGVARISAVISGLSSRMSQTIRACIGGGACATFTVRAASGPWRILGVSGTGQVAQAGLGFSPVVIQLVDQTGAALAGAQFSASQVYFAPQEEMCLRGACAPPVRVSEGSSTGFTGVDGTATIQPLSPTLPGKVAITVSAGVTSADYVLEISP